MHRTVIKKAIDNRNKKEISIIRKPSLANIYFSASNLHMTQKNKKMIKFKLCLR